MRVFVTQFVYIMFDTYHTTEITSYYTSKGKHQHGITFTGSICVKHRW